MQTAVVCITRVSYRGTTRRDVVCLSCLEVTQVCHKPGFCCDLVMQAPTALLRVAVGFPSGLAAGLAAGDWTCLPQ